MCHFLHIPEYICGKNLRTGIAGIKKGACICHFENIAKLLSVELFALYNFKIILFQLNLENLFHYSF